MTLQEAHEIQRRELISLRAENKRLKLQASGLFPIEEKETLQRHVRHLEQKIKTLQARHDSARAIWKHTDEQCSSLRIEIALLEEQVSALTAENGSLRIRAENAETEVLMLNGTNRRLVKKVNTDFENSSLPSSALPFRKKNPQQQEALRQETRRTERPQGTHRGKACPCLRPHTPSRPARIHRQSEHLPDRKNNLQTPHRYPCAR